MNICKECGRESGSRELCEQCTQTHKVRGHSEHQDDTTADASSGGDGSHPILDPEMRVGETLSGYELKEVLGTGGMGVVYLAEHARVGRRVALKMLHPEFAMERTSIRRFFFEARLVARLWHPNIVAITDFVEQSGGDTYLVMELLEGTNLRQALYATTAMPLSRTLHICEQATAALAAAHAEGIVHRDLKPSNIILTRNAGDPDFVKVVDFGIAKLLTPTRDFPDYESSRRVIVGTPHFMSPEQARGEAVDARSDIFSLGVVIYRMLTGELPYRPHSFGNLIDLHNRINLQPPSAAGGVIHRPRLPRTVDRLVMACLENDPNQRPQDIKEVGAELHALNEARGGDDSVRVLDGGPLGAQQITNQLRIAVRRPVPMAVAICAIVAALISVGLGRIEVGPSPGVPEAERAAAVTTTDADQRDEDDARVTIRFVSSPDGMEVRRVGEEVALGHTPFSLSLPRNDTRQLFELRDADGQVATRAVVPTHDAIVDVTQRATQSATATEPESTSPPRRPARSRPRSRDAKQQQATPDPLSGLRDPWAE